MAETESDPRLRRWYAEYRRRFFSNLLPLPGEIAIYYDRMSDHADCDDENMPHNGEFIVRINILWREHPEMSKLCLLHEMAHMHLWPYQKHGKRFQEEMKRIALAGGLRAIW